MTELRWIKRQTLKVLQSRERYEGYPKEWIAGQKPPLVTEWGEWKDVPIVSDDGDYAG